MYFWYISYKSLASQLLRTFPFSSFWNIFLELNGHIYTKYTKQVKDYNSSILLSYPQRDAALHCIYRKGCRQQASRNKWTFVPMPWVNPSTHNEFTWTFARKITGANSSSPRWKLILGSRTRHSRRLCYSSWPNPGIDLPFRQSMETLFSPAGTGWQRPLHQHHEPPWCHNMP